MTLQVELENRDVALGLRLPQLAGGYDRSLSGCGAVCLESELLLTRLSLPRRPSGRARMRVACCCGAAP